VLHAVNSTCSRIEQTFRNLNQGLFSRFFDSRIEQTFRNLNQGLFSRFLDSRIKQTFRNLNVDESRTGRVHG
jgi:hypothetical protein